MLCGKHPERDERCETVVPGRYATAVTIYNPSACKVLIEKYFAPLVLREEAIGREPRTVPARPFAKIELGPGEATMDDCCSLEQAIGPVAAVHARRARRSRRPPAGGGRHPHSRRA